MTGRWLLSLIVLAAVPRLAAAGEPALNDRARRAIEAIEELRYEEAAVLLGQALEEGDSGPAELAVIFRLQGEVAATLGDDAAAETHFRRLLALDPEARLPVGTSPKIVTWFDAAHAWFQGREPLRVHHEVGGRGVTLVVDSDPLGMVSGAVATFRASGGGAPERVETRGGTRLELAAPGPGSWQASLAAVDTFGNRLVEVGPVEVADEEERGGVVDPPPPSGPPPSVDAPVRRPIYARWPLWTGLAAVAGGAAIYFGLEAESEQDELDRLNADSANHAFSEADEVRERLERDVTIANVSFAAAGAFGVAAVIFLVAELRGDDDGVRVDAAVTPSSAGVSVSVGF